MNRNNCLLLLLLFLISIIITHIPLSHEYSQVPTSYAANTEYSLQFLLNNGYILEPHHMSEYVFTSYTTGIFVSQVYLINQVLLSVIFLVSLKDPTIHYYNFDPWIGDIFQFIFLVCNLALVNKMTKFDNDHLNIFNSKYLNYYIGFVLFGSYTIFAYAQKVSNAYICYILLITTFLSFSEKKSVFVIISIFLSFMIPVYYQTPGLVYLMIMITMILYKSFSNYSKYNINNKYLLNYDFFLLYLTFWFAYNIYVTQGYFYTMIEGIKNFFLVKQNLVVDPLSAYTIVSSNSSIILNFLNGLFVAFPVVYYLIKVRKMNSNSKSFIIPLILSLSLLTVFFYSYGGLWILYQRIAEWGSIISIIIIGILFFTSQNESKKVFVIISILAVISTFSVHVVTSETLSCLDSMTVQEDSAGNSLANHMQMNSRVLTDNRLIGSFVKNNRFNIIGINDLNINKSETIKDLSYIYYSTDDKSIELQKFLNKYGPNYLFFSKTMSNAPPGIKGYDRFFKAADKNYLQKFENSTKMNLIYANNQVLIFYC